MLKAGLIFFDKLSINVFWSRAHMAQLMAEQ